MGGWVHADSRRAIWLTSSSSPKPRTQDRSAGSGRRVLTEREGGGGTDKQCPRSVGPGILNHRQSLPRVHKHQHSHRSKTSLSYQLAYHADQLSGALTNTSATIKHSLLHTQTQTRKMKNASQRKTQSNKYKIT